MYQVRQILPETFKGFPTIKVATSDPRDIANLKFIATHASVEGFGHFAIKYDEKSMVVTLVAEQKLSRGQWPTEVASIECSSKAAKDLLIDTYPRYFVHHYR